MDEPLAAPVQYLKGVGPRRAAILEGAGIRTVEDLLKYRPFRYEDRTRLQPIRQLMPDREALFEATVAATGQYATPRKQVRIFQLLAEDPSGSIPIKFFNAPWLKQVFRKGQRVFFYGTPRFDTFSRELSLINPEFEILEESEDITIHTGRIVPIYRRIGPITTRVFRQIIFRELASLPGQELRDPIPAAVRSRYRFPERSEAFRHLHFPECSAGEPARTTCLKELQDCRSGAHQRFIFEEFFLFQLGLQTLRRHRRLVPKAREILTGRKVREAIKSILPFRPTAAQKLVLGEIVQDLRSDRVMNRLLQGDVGSGKTLVALQALLVVIENGFQTALMAPTEILAEQHFQNLQSYLNGTGYRLGFLTAGVKGRPRRELLARLREGAIDLLVGTHALIQEDVVFHNLALVVIDEQHRFGVVQRSRLMEKGSRPDTLVMTATPIPRSLALTVYGDLDVSIIDELPPGRQPVKTVIKTEAGRAEVYRVLREQLKAGRQVYVVYPLIEESEKVTLKAASEMFETLQSRIFPESRVGLLHGRMKSRDKEALMQQFKAGEIRVLVATTVIEVGIDVSNASVMVIENAEQFGLSQLHQLRGRIGRGRHAGLCILMIEKVSSRDAYERLDIMRKSSDGFRIAEKDLEIRGPGEFVGTRQSGVPEFLFGNIVRDRKLLELARNEAEQYLAALLNASSGKEAEILASIAARWRERYRLFEVG